MGRISAEGIAETDLSLEQQIAWHLQSNHYPPVPEMMVAPCLKAIEHANAGEWDVLIDLPNPVTWRGNSYAPVTEIVGQHHLETWIADGDL